MMDRTPIVCHHCGHAWATRSRRTYVSCPDCLYKVRVPVTGPTLDEIRAALRQQLSHYRQTYGVTAVRIFGSYARGDPRLDSDLDVLLVLDPDFKLSLFGLARLQAEMSAQLGIAVDLAIERSLYRHLGEAIREEAIPV